MSSKLNEDEQKDNGREATITNPSKERNDSSAEDIKVHSANSWETAELGDNERKNKFLRLMGAGKHKEHHGKIVIGDHTPSHPRQKTDAEKISHELENQYNEGLSLKLSGGARAHKGFGFSEEKTENVTVTDEKPSSEKSELQDESSVDKSHVSQTDHPRELEKRKFEENPPSQSETKPSFEKKMKFVKSSS